MSEAPAKCKLADAGDIFLKKKKTTQSNTKLVFDAVRSRHRDIIDFEETEQSFYKIMSHFVKGMNFVPEDVRHVKLKENLFQFVMENTKYTQVKLIFKFLNPQCICNY